MQKLTKYECILYFSTYITPSLVVIVLFFGLGNRGTFCLCFCRPAFCRRHFLKMGLTNSHLTCMPGTGILDLLCNILVCTLQLWVHRVLFDPPFRTAHRRAWWSHLSNAEFLGENKQKQPNKKVCKHLIDQLVPHGSDQSLYKSDLSLVWSSQWIHQMFVKPWTLMHGYVDANYRQFPST